jgi:Peptide methionine sulfoxide reductase
VVPFGESTLSESRIGRSKVRRPDERKRISEKLGLQTRELNGEEVMRMLFSHHRTKMITPSEALSGREQRAFAVPERHAVLGTPLEPPFPEGTSTAVFGLGCFWGAERKFWKIDGVYTTAVGYAGGFTPNPTYEEVCGGRTGHTEAVLVVFDPENVSYRDLLRGVLGGTRPNPGDATGQRHRHAVPLGDLLLR